MAPLLVDLAAIRVRARPEAGHAPDEHMRPEGHCIGAGCPGREGLESNIDRWGPIHRIPKEGPFDLPNRGCARGEPLATGRDGIGQPESLNEVAHRVAALSALKLINLLEAVARKRELSHWGHGAARHDLKPAPRDTEELLEVLLGQPGPAYPAVGVERRARAYATELRGVRLQPEPHQQVAHDQGHLATRGAALLVEFVDHQRERVLGVEQPLAESAPRWDSRMPASASR